MNNKIRFLYALKFDGKIFHRRIYHYAALELQNHRNLSTLRFSCHNSEQDCINKITEYLLNKEEVEIKTKVRFEKSEQIIVNGMR